jgi:hypothetical protein
MHVQRSTCQLTGQTVHEHKALFLRGVKPATEFLFVETSTRPVNFDTHYLYYRYTVQ